MIYHVQRKSCVHDIGITWQQVRTLQLRTIGRQYNHALHSVKRKGTVLTCRCRKSGRATPFFQLFLSFPRQYQILRVYLRRHHCGWRGSHRMVILLEWCCGDRLSSDCEHQWGLPALRRSDREPFEGSVHGLIHGTDWTRSLSRFLMR